MPTNGKPTSSRFQLPSITPVNYSLTDGTDIPPPPDSPIEATPPPPKPTATPTIINPVDTTSANGSYDGRGRKDGSPPLSPASSKRPSSIRRFLSRKSLNENYTNSAEPPQDGPAGIKRPESSLSYASKRPSVASKRSGSWFRRLGSSKRTSVVYENGAVEETAKAKAVPKGPPPPTLPELNQLKSKVSADDQGSFGAEDMFKNIK